MIIRRDQIRAFEAYMKQSFEDRMVAHMAQRYPRQYEKYTSGGLDDTGARDLVRRAIEKASAIQARREGSIQQMLEIMLETSPEFERDDATAWTREILADNALAGGTRILLVHQKLHERLAAGAPTTERKG